MRTTRTLTSGLAAAAIAAAAVGTSLASPATADAETRWARGGVSENLPAVGLTSDDRLVRFRTASPGSATVVGEVTGLDGDTSLVGIDYRVQDGLLYAVGDAGGIYTVTTRDAVATKVSQLTTALDGTQFGVDFNPAADALRIISDTSQNLRHSVPTDTTTTDIPLTYPPATTPATGVSMAAYTNNDLDLDSGTSLFDIDTNLDQVAAQSPANNGTLSATGKLGVTVRAPGGFDIYSELGADGRTEALRGFATLSPEGGTRFALYSVRALRGDATRIGAFPTGLRVSDIAVRLDQG